ncbi:MULTISPECIES: poly-gamma-glutamate synthase PgsB [unclassified Francisella]|uniref:poly-gamma-glutamate synthase PgsB n=1 Tax=unclassified Francisella TaxID=2610885 RepID=UPI002E31F4DB|nr:MULTISPECIES: poly-gamma-glutamate synthase PgsB [unclassified Francisella]MED7818606.1 poly-gamma-glutamate synthase PgsB [Francisella sp. 19S2-4]MED7829442.1 poly-gamma-glutamate synthase PgsB [Francisella sp. 19S2-10]
MDFWLIIGVFVILCFYLIIENIIHNISIKSIPIRIHVNGTRGKSSVARLIAAGVRAGGYTTVAKTTGTLARYIDVDGSETPVFRIGFSNIAEQVKIMFKAKRAKADAIIIECMALQPLLQSLCELKLIKATHGVLTNARPDHLDVMGPTERDVAKALAGTVPINSKYFTAEDVYLDFFEYACKDRGSQLIAATVDDAEKISDEEINKFVYSEFKINVALALKVTDDLGIPRDVALKGMWEATPDPGAMTEYNFNIKDSEMNFANAFAANDPVSTKMLWDKLYDKYRECQKKVLVVNCRADREDRSKQIAEAILGWEKPDLVTLIGTGTDVFVSFYKKYAKSLGIKPEQVIICEDMKPLQILEKIYSTQKAESYMLVGVGNIKDIGMDLVDYCDQSHKSKHDL